MPILYEGGDSCFINYLVHSISGKCVQSMFKLSKKKKKPYENLNSLYPYSVPGVDFIRIGNTVQTCQCTDSSSELLCNFAECVS